MHRRHALAVVAALVVVLASMATGLGVSGGATPRDPGASSVAAPPTVDANRTAGAHLAARVAAHDERVDGGIERAGFLRAVNDASTDEGRARVASETLTRGLDRLEALRAERERLDAARANGSLPPGAYRTRSARVAAAAAALERLATHLAATAEDLPAALRDEYDLGAARTDRLREGAGRLAPADRTFDAAFYARLSGMVKPYNANVDGESGFVAGRLAGEVVDLRVVDGDDRTTVSFRVGDDGTIGAFRAGARPDATVRLTADRATVDAIARAENPREAFLTALDRGEVAVRGLGPLNRLEWAAVDLLGEVVGGEHVGRPVGVGLGRFVG